MSNAQAAYVYRTALTKPRMHECNAYCINDAHFEVVYEFLTHSSEEQVIKCFSFVEILHIKRVLEFVPETSIDGYTAIGAYGITFKWR